jgi:hypothetical protein
MNNLRSENFPGFTAEASLEKPPAGYQSDANLHAPTYDGLVVPQRPRFYGVCLGFLGCWGIWVDV